MKRRLLTIAIFLVLGAVVNVAVAWGCAVWSGLAPIWHFAAPTSDEEAWWEAHAPETVVTEPAIVFSTTGLGVKYSSLAGSRTAGGQDVRITDIDENGFAIERLTWTWAEFAGLRWDHLLRAEVGWPVTSLVGGRWKSAALREVVFGGPRGMAPAEGAVYAAAVPINRTSTRGRVERLLPLRPLSVGFLVNTLFYAALLWLLIPGPFVLRRFLRVRRGLCPKCAYPMGESGVCSECGIALPKRASTT